jgi:tripartite-type tricarboxylate transporter receptor subunit TctC
MKRTILALLGLVAATTAKAEELTYYMMTTANSPLMKITEPMITKLRENYTIDWKQNAGCAVRNQVNKETKPIFVELVTGQMWMSLQDGNNNCVIELDKIRWVMITDTAYKLCVKADNTVQNFNDLVAAKNAKFGYATGTIGKPLIEGLNKDIGSSWSPIILTNSNSLLTALMAKDVDAAMLNIVTADAQVAAGNLRCVATTQRDQETSLSKLSPKTNKILTEWTLSFALGLKNVNDQQYAKISENIKATLPKVEMPKNVIVTSIIDTKEEILKKKVEDATINLYAITK